jgi:RNA polymerase sigma-70 factor (ECF subfamily)
VGKIDSQKYLSNLIDQYQNLVFSICYKITKDYFASEDLMQETFLSAFQHRESFDGKNEKSWIARIATNKSIDYINQAGRRMVPTEDADMEQYKSRIGRPEAEALEKDFKEKLKENCESLTPPYDEISYLYFCEEKNPKEIATILQKNVKTIQTQIYRARNALRKIYEKERSR